MWFSCLAFFIVWFFCLADTQAAVLVTGGAGGGGWASKLSGDVSYKLGQVSLGSDLDLSKTKVSPKAWADVGLSIPLFPNLHADLVIMKYSGSNTVTDLGFGDYTFNGSISSKLKLNQYDLLLYYHIPFFRTVTANVLDVRWGLAAKYFDGYVKVKGPANGQIVTEKKDFKFVIPMVYAGATLSPPALPLKIHIDARALSYDGSYYYDIEGKVSAKILNIPPMGDLYVSGGYRLEQIRLKPGSPVDDLETDSTIQGVFIELGIRF